MFSRRHSDLALENDPSTKFLPWLIAFMVFLASLAIAASVVLSSITARWDISRGDNLTIQFLPHDDPAQDKRQVENILATLNVAPGVMSSVIYSREQSMKLLEPWLGSAELGTDLPLPHLIDVQIDPADLDLVHLKQQLATMAGNLTVDDHRVWLQRLVRIGRSLEIASAIILGLIGFATVSTIFFTTRTGLAIHHEVIEVMHLIGARDDYIARQFGDHALRLGWRGGIIGLLIALPTLGGIGYLFASLDDVLLPELTLNWTHGAILASLPVGVAWVARLTARRTVMRTLIRMI